MAPSKISGFWKLIGYDKPCNVFSTTSAWLNSKWLGNRSGLGLLSTYPHKTQIAIQSWTTEIKWLVSDQICNDSVGEGQWVKDSEPAQALINNIDTRYHDSVAVNVDISTYNAMTTVSLVSPLFVHCVLKLLLSHATSRKSHRLH